MSEIPVPLIRANQIFMVATILASFILNRPSLLILPAALQVAPLLFGPRANLVMAVARKLLHNKLAGAKSESADLQRFNQTLAAVMLVLSVVLFTSGQPVYGWIFALMTAAAAAAALAGFCIGCLLYYRLKTFLHVTRAR